MFDRYVAEKVKIEKEIADEIEIFTRETVLGSSLSDFTKNYIIRNTDPGSPGKIADDVYSQIEKAVKLRFNYAIRPKWTLINFLFNKYESRPPQEIISRLAVFSFYKFYKDAITNFIHDNSLVFITDKQVSGVIDETNGLIYEKLSDNISNVKIKNFFLQLFKLKYEYDHEINLDSSIPFLFIKIFLEDKSFNDQLKKFDVLDDLRDQTEINLKDIIKILTGKYSFTRKTAEESAPIEIELNKPAAVNPDQVKNNNNAPVTGEEETEKLVISDEDIYPGHSRDEDVIEMEQPAREGISEDEHWEIRVISDASLQEKESTNAIKKLFTEEELKEILNRVYLSDKILRHKSFEKLNNMKEWKDAIAHLSEIFEENNVDIYDKSVVLFVDVLNDHFKRIENKITG